jgi:predicted nucleic acid-binding protein
MHFLDTNILLYAGSQAPEDQPKRQKAVALIQEGDFAVSAQVLQEFIANALGKKALGFTETNITDTLMCLRSVRVLPITHTLVEQAWSLRQRFKISYWDAAIVAAALELGCHTIYSEDLNHGQDYGGVRGINPFR